MYVADVAALTVRSLAFGDDAQLLHHAEIVAHPPMLDRFAVLEAHDVHVVLFHRATCGRHAHQGSSIGARHREATGDAIPFGDQILDSESQVRECGSGSV